MYEHRSAPLIPHEGVRARVAASAASAAAVCADSLLAGTLGCHGLAHITRIDSLCNASLILGGTGPVDRRDSNPGKLLASALFSGFTLLTSVALLPAPMVHRVMHRVHLEAASPGDETKS